MANQIDAVLQTILTNIKEMVDVNTIIGEPIITPDGTSIIPVSQVFMGFGSGGSDYPNTTSAQMPFGGGGGAGVSIVPIAFLVCTANNVKLMPIDRHISSIDRMIELVPELIDKVNGLLNKKKGNDEISEEIY